MKTDFLDSFTPTFKKKTEILKIETIKMDAFRLMQFYLSNRIAFNEYNNSIKRLSKLKLLSELELFDYTKSKAIYEAYQYAIGQSKEERQLLKNRLAKLIDKHKKL